MYEVTTYALDIKLNCLFFCALINFFTFLFIYRILVGAPLGKNPQPNTTRSGTLMKCPITQNQDDCTDVLTDGRQSKINFLFCNF